MLTSIRGLSAASLSAGLFLSATPALANEAASDEGASENATITQEISAELITAPPADIVLTPAFERALAPVEQDKANKLGEESGFTFSANVALASEYRFRGVDLSGGEVAIQGGFDISHSSGFYVGTWASSLDEDTVGYGSTELDLYGGWTGDLTDGLSADVGFIAYTYPDAPAGDFDYYEFYTSLSFDLGPASATVGAAYAPGQDGLDFGGGQDDNLYFYTDVGFAIPSTPVTVTGHLGYTDGVLTFTNDSKAFDWSIGAEAAVFGPISVSIAYVEAEGDIPVGFYDFTDGTVVGTISASF